MLDIAAAYERHAAQLRRYVARRVGDEADDILGDLWLEACERASAYEDRGYPVSSWLYRIAQSRIVDRARQARRRPTLPLTEWSASYDAPDVAHLDARDDARRVLAAMLPDQARACWLRYAVGLDGGETAQAMGRSRGAVKALTHRGKERAHV